VLDEIGAVVGIPVPLQEASRRPGDPAELVADASRFQRDFSWRPQHSDLDTIIRTAWDWLSDWKNI
jgi:UDP-glucose 4-epimerase